MSKLKAVLSSCFTLNTSATSSWFPFMRIGTALCLIVKTCYDWAGINFFYGTTALVPASITDTYIHHFVPSFHWLLRFTTGHVADSTIIHAFFFIHLVLGLLLLLGYRLWLTAGLCWLMQTMILNSSPLIIYGFDGILLSLLFYIFIFELGYVWLGKGDDSNSLALSHLFQKTLQLHLCIIYFISGIFKARSWVWTEGDLLFNIVQHPQFTHFLSPVALKLFAFPYISLFACWFTIIIETFYPIAIWVRGINKIYLLGILFLHFLIGLFMGIWLFAVIMLVFNLAAFGHILLEEK